MDNLNSDLDFFVNEEEEEDGELDLSGNNKIDFTGKDSDIDSLFRQFQKGRLTIQPNYQRKYVWDAKKASLLIESILINIPIPIVYLAATSDDKINVIDGQQRLTSIFSFISGKFPTGENFKLTGLQVLKDLNGKTFGNLEQKYQNIIFDYSIRTITFSADSDPDLQYEIFSRLNTGSVSLNEQELRNCVFRGPFNDFIKELASDHDYLELLGIKDYDKRMQDVELVLRFIAFYKNSYINYKSPIKLFLNDTMRTFKNIDEIDKKKISEAFKRAVTNLNSLLGDKSFRKYKLDPNNNNEGVWEKQINRALFDILMDSMARTDTTVVMRHLDSIREALIDLMASNRDFAESIMIKTSDAVVVRKRFEMWNQVLSDIIKDDKADTRCFSKQFKQKLFDTNPTCAICNQNINSIDDAAVDHIQQYWLGGKTIPENARLTHRYCNNTRPRLDKVEA